MSSTTKKKGRDADGDNNDTQHAAKKRRILQDPAKVTFAPVPAVKPEPISIDLDNLLVAPGDEQSVDLDDIVADFPRVEAAVEVHNVLIVQDVAAILREYITHTLVLGETLPLLKVKIIDKVNLIVDVTKLALLAVEIRYVSAVRGDLLPDWFQAGDSRQRNANATAENTFALRRPDLDPNALPERKERDVAWVTGMHFQDAMQEMRTTTGCKLNNLQHGGVMTVDTNIYLTKAALAAIKKDMLTVAMRRFLIAKSPFERFDDTFSIRTILGAQSSVVTMIVSIINELTVNTSQAIWAEMVAWLIHVKEIEPDLLSTTMRINRAFGMRFPAYVMVLYGRLIQSQDEMQHWGFDGNFTSLTELILSREALMTRLLAWEEDNMIPGHALKDYQRNAVLDMIVQEYVDKDFVDKVQGGARGKEHYADPGTGKTLMMLAAAFFIDSLPSDNTNGKTLFIIPPSALNAFRTEIFNHLKNAPEIYGFTEKQILRINIDPEEPPYSNVQKDKKAFDSNDMRYLFITHNKFSELTTTETVDNLIFKYPWKRVILDEAHVFIGRTSNRFRYLVHAISPASPRYLLTGTAVSTAVSDIIGQVRLMGYRASADEDTRVTQFVADPKNKGKFDALDSVGYKETADIGMAYGPFKGGAVVAQSKNANKKLYPMEESLLTEFKSRSILRMINRVQNTSGSIDGKKLVDSPFAQSVQAYSGNGPVRNLSEVYTALDKLLTKIMENEIRPINQLLEEIQSLETALNEQLIEQIKSIEARNGDNIDPADLTAERRAFAVDKVAKSTHDPAFQKLGAVIKTVYRLAATRNYGVDLQLLSPGHLNKLRAKIKKLVPRTPEGAYDDPDNPDILDAELVLKYLENLKPYEKVSPALLKFFELPDANEISVGLEKWINPDGVRELPLRYREILNRLDTHLHSGPGKVIVFFTDRTALLAFTAWFYLTTREEGTDTPYYPLLTKKGKKEEKKGTKEGEKLVEFIGDWKDHGPYWNFALLNNEKSPEERERMIAWFTNPLHPVKALFTTYEVAETGYNFQAADMVILAQQPYSDATRVQATARAYRIGQTRDVEVVDMWSANTGESVVRATRKYRQQVGTRLDALLAEAKLLQEADKMDKYTMTTFNEYSIPLGRIDPEAYQTVIMTATTPPEPKKVQKRLPVQVAAKPPKPRKKKTGAAPVEIVFVDAMDIDEHPPAKTRPGKHAWLDIAIQLDPDDPTQMNTILQLVTDASRGGDPMDTSANAGNHSPLVERKRLEEQMGLVEVAYEALLPAWSAFNATPPKADAKAVGEFVKGLLVTLKNLEVAKRETHFTEWAPGAAGAVQEVWVMYHDLINGSLAELTVETVDRFIRVPAKAIVKGFESFDLYNA